MNNKIITFLKTIINHLQFLKFEIGINPLTWSKHETILENVSQIEKDPVSNFESSIISQTGTELKEKVLKEFKDKYISLEEIRILIHIPSKETSPGGYSAFMNIADSFRYIGIPTCLMLWDDKIEDHLSNFFPTVLLSSNNSAYLNRINWQYIKEYRKKSQLRIGLTASVDDFKTNHSERLNWLKENKIDFFYGFRSPEYFRERPDYQVLIKAGYEIFSLEFGANPLLYYPISGIKKDINFVFLASSNMDKRKRYYQWLPSIVNKYSGFIDGPGWHKNKGWAPQNVHKYLYARARVGLNLHIDDSINWASELNERTYILAACGIPQLVDNAKLLPYRFSEKAFFVANSPEEYFQLYEYILKNPDEAEYRALVALKEVYKKHTTFHRAETFVHYLLENKVTSNINL